MSNTTYLRPFPFLLDACRRLQNGSAFTADFSLIAEGAIYCDDRDTWKPWPYPAN